MVYGLSYNITSNSPLAQVISNGASDPLYVEDNNGVYSVSTTMLTLQYDHTFEVGQRYVVQNDVWGESPYTTGNQNVLVLNRNSTAFTIGASNANQSTVAAYPDEYSGDIANSNNSTTGWSNIQVSNLQSASYSWSVTTKSGGSYLPGTYNAASDIWFCTSGTSQFTGTCPGGAELMIWMDATNQLTPAVIS